MKVIDFLELTHNLNTSYVDIKPIICSVVRISKIFKYILC